MAVVSSQPCTTQLATCDLDDWLLNTLPHTAVSSAGWFLAPGDLSRDFYMIGYCIVPRN